MLRSGRPNLAPLRAFGIATLGTTVLFTIAAGAGIRVNTSYSLPMGIYRVSVSGQFLEFCPAEPFASESRARGYRTQGLACPDGAVPLLKPVVAKEGDLVELSQQGLAVNARQLPKTQPLTADAAGRPLRSWPPGSYPVRPGTVWVASTYDRGSYDSRYMGPVDLRQIRRRLEPLWVFTR